MQQHHYDKRSSKTVNGEKVSYGIIYGNEKIVFIKVGSDGDIKGYQDKYLKMAHRIHQRLGATVICASNPWTDRDLQLAADKAIISNIAANCDFADFAVFFVGISDGGYYNLHLAQAVPQAATLLGINPSLSTMDDLIAQLQKIPQVKKRLVFGTKDDDFACVPFLQQLDCANLEILTVEGADHRFTGMVDEFVALIDLL